jgi:hypothetical protein
MKSIARVEDLGAYDGSRDECDDDTFLGECVEEVVLMAWACPE